MTLFFFYNRFGKLHYQVGNLQQEFLTLLKLNVFVFISTAGECSFKQKLKTHTEKYCI